jgi:hypothetical protein
LRTCPKCGRANDVTRKFCVRCGASLLVVAEETKPKPSAVVIPEIGRVTTAASLKRSSVADAPAGTDESRGAEKPEVVAPREVRRPEPEMAAEIPEEAEITPSLDEISPEEAGVKEPTKTAEVQYEEGKEIVKQILEKVREAEAQAKKEASPSAPEPPEALTEIAEIEEEAAFSLPEHKEIETRVASRPERVPATMPETETRGAVPSVAAAAVSTTADEYLRDEKVRKIELDIKAFSTEHRQLQSDMDKLRMRLDAEVERYRTTADAKKARAESIARDLTLAKKEWDEADKEYKNAEDHRKKELSTAERRIEDVDKRSKKAEDAKRKRIEEIEKAKQKLEEESKKT